MNFLVLGASSFYGSNFAKCVREHGDSATLLSRPEWNLGDDIPSSDCVVNFASRSLVAESWADPQGWMMTNAVLTTALLDQVREIGTKFIHISTPEVYGNTSLPVREGAQFNPTTPYAVSRAAADMMIAAYIKAYDFPAIITRTANIYGLGQPDYRFIPRAFKMLRSGQKLFLDGDGGTLRGWLHVKDACEATYLLCKQGVLGQTYHIAPGDVLTVRAIAEMICEQLGVDPGSALECREDRLGKDLAYVMLSEKIRFLGWRETIGIKEGLEEYGNHLAVS